MKKEKFSRMRTSLDSFGAFAGFRCEEAEASSSVSQRVYLSLIIILVIAGYFFTKLGPSLFLTELPLS